MVFFVFIFQVLTVWKIDGIIRLDGLFIEVIAMKYFKLINGGTYHIDEFEERTNKESLYYQNGSKYALCPTCGSSIQLIGGE